MNCVRYPLVPQRVAQNAILLFLPLKSNFCWKKSATKILCVKTFSGSVVARPSPYLTVNRWIVGDVPSIWNLRSKWPTPLENVYFVRFRSILPQPWELAKEVWLSPMRSRQCALQFASSHRWTLCVIPKSLKGCLSYLLLQIIVDTSNLVWGLNVACYVISLQMINYPWKGVVTVTWPL